MASLYQFNIVLTRELLPALWMSSFFVLVTSKYIFVLVYDNRPPLPSNRHCRSNGDHLEGKRENYQVCSVPYCVQQLYPVNCTDMNRTNSSLDWVLSHWAHFTVLRFIFGVCIIVSDCMLHACVVL